MTNESPTGSRVNAEMLVGISAVIIGLCALGVSLYETSLMRQEQRASVMPILELSRSYFVDRSNPDEPRTHLSFEVENVGIGPARVRDFRVFVDGEPQLTWEPALRTLSGQDSPVSYVQSTINGRTIPADRRITAMRLLDTRFVGAIVDGYERLTYEACYCSIFDDCWVVSSTSYGAEPEEAMCRTDDASFQE